MPRIQRANPTDSACQEGQLVDLSQLRPPTGCPGQAAEGEEMSVVSAWRVFWRAGGPIGADPTLGCAISILYRHFNHLNFLPITAIHPTLLPRLSTVGITLFPSILIQTSQPYLLSSCLLLDQLSQLLEDVPSPFLRSRYCTQRLLFTSIG